MKATGKRTFAICEEPAAAAAKVSTGRTSQNAHHKSAFDRNVLRQYLTSTPTSSSVVAKDILYQEAGKFVLILDKFPKARVHLLIVIDHEWLGASTVRQVTSQHLPQLLEIDGFLQKVKKELEEGVAEEPGVLSNALKRIDRTHLGGGHSLMIGFHSTPSLFPLHIHVVSDDLSSPCMRNKKHWNSFSTPFFVPLDTVLGRCSATATGAAPPSSIPDEVESERLLRQELRCHKCTASFSTMPSLKAHLVSEHD
jgi:aprataxin